MTTTTTTRFVGMRSFAVALMIFFFFFFCCCLATSLMGMVSAAEETEKVMIPPSPYATDLSSSNFYSTLSKGQWIVLFYEDWCGICQRVDGPWKEASKLVTQNRNSSVVDSVQFARIRCSKYPHICLAHGVIAYPVIKYFHGDVEREWNHERTFENFVAFSREITKELPTELESIEPWLERDQQLRKKKSQRMAFLYVGEAPKFKQLFRSAGRDYTDVADFFSTNDIDVARGILNTQDVQLDSIWALSGSAKLRYQNSISDQSALSSFVKQHQYPFFEYIAESNREYELMVSEKPVLMVITLGYNEDEIRTIESIATSIEDYRLIHINALNLGTINWLNSLNISPQSAPRLVYWDVENEIKYYSDSARETDDIVIFIKNFINGIEKGEYEPSGRLPTFDERSEKFLLWISRRSYPIAYFLGLCTVYPVGIVIAFAVVTFIFTIVFVVYVMSDDKKPPATRQPSTANSTSTSTTPSQKKGNKSKTQKTD